MKLATQTEIAETLRGYWTCEQLEMLIEAAQTKLALRRDVDGLSREELSVLMDIYDWAVSP